ncbi:hypothetical protein GF354_06145 [Candidatus Peregrinibacteria bacterium]|nr:hypothetical protein [Candidatus Peregrinibacteria bacterium]
MITFPYVEYLGLAEDRVFRPVIPVIFQANGEEFKNYCLIDSGADYSILPIEIAGKFNLELGSQPRYTVQGAGGSRFTIYRSPIEIDHIIKKRGFRDIKWKSTVYFSESGSTILLGQNGNNRINNRDAALNYSHEQFYKLRQHFNWAEAYMSTNELNGLASISASIRELIKIKNDEQRQELLLACSLFMQALSNRRTQKKEFTLPDEVEDLVKEFRANVSIATKK